MMFPIRRGQINKYSHPQNHDLEELNLMQNGIFLAGDKFDIKTLVFTTFQNE